MSRQVLLRKLRAVLAQILRPCGYLTGPLHDTRPLLAYAFRDRKGKLTTKRVRGFVVQSFMGFTEEGIIDDAYGGGLSTICWSGIPTEDLEKLLRVAEAEAQRQLA